MPNLFRWQKIFLLKLRQSCSPEKTGCTTTAAQADVFLSKNMYAPADLLERIRLLLIRKRGPKRAELRALPGSQAGAA